MLLESTWVPYMFTAEVTVTVGKSWKQPKFYQLKNKQSNCVISIRSSTHLETQQLGDRKEALAHCKQDEISRTVQQLSGL